MNTLKDFSINSSSMVMDAAVNWEDEALLFDFMAVTENAEYIYLFLGVLGVVLNSYILCRLIAQACTNPGRFLDGSGMPLAMMTVADLVSLLLIFLSFIIMKDLELDHSARGIHCKVSMFLIHTMTGVSKWCWMVASGQRYVAVYHPFSNLSRSRRGPRIVLVLVVLSAAMNSWLLLAVDANESDETRCAEADFILNNNSINRALHAVEIGWSYLAPVLLTGAMDARVFLTQPPRMVLRFKRNVAVDDDRERLALISTPIQLQMRPSITTAIRQQRPQATVARLTLIHWLLITTINLMLNTPDNAIRLLILFGLLCENCAIPWKPFESRLTLSIVIIVRLLYFAQFSFNAVFLTTIIYRQRYFRRPSTSYSVNVRTIQSTVL